ncbi:hypothetical protein ABZY93_15515 [Streptomyces smyrnaeus]|uniref:hypothetical protein n=1 Tax=Streptomyces smyrnaeus TaxID=1387713 RepID=UPI0033A2D439
MEQRLRAHQLRECEEKEARRAAERFRAERYIRGLRRSRIFFMLVVLAGAVATVMAIAEAIPIHYALGGLAVVAVGLFRAVESTGVIWMWSRGRLINVPKG